MNEDVKDLLQMIKTCSKNLDAKLTLDSGCCKCLLDYIGELQEQIFDPEYALYKARKFIEEDKKRKFRH